MEIFYQLCLKLGIKILMLNGTRLGGMVYISEVVEKIDYLEKEINENGKNRSLEDLRNILFKTHSFDDAAKYTSQFLKSKKIKSASKRLSISASLLLIPTVSKPLAGVIAGFK